MGFYSGLLCEDAVKNKKNHEAVFFGLCAIAAAFFSSTMAIICFLVLHEDIARGIITALSAY